MKSYGPANHSRCNTERTPEGCRLFHGAFSLTSVRYELSSKTRSRIHPVNRSSGSRQKFNLATPKFEYLETVPCSSSTRIVGRRNRKLHIHSHVIADLIRLNS